MLFKYGDDDETKYIENLAEETGIGGWLIIPLLNLIASTVLAAVRGVQQFSPIFRDGTWQLLTDPSSLYYNSDLSGLIVFEIAGYVVWVVLGAAALALFFIKSRLAPRFVIAWLIFIPVFLMLDAVAGAEMSLDTGNNLFMIVGMVIFDAVWIPYFLVSKRVKRTFVKGRNWRRAPASPNGELHD
jgi:hypothetical protein